MPKKAAGLDVLSAVRYLGESVLVELGWDDETEPFWRFGHVVGIVLPFEGVSVRPCLMVKSPGDDFPLEVFLSDIQSIRTIRPRAPGLSSRLPWPLRRQGQVTEGECRHA